MHLDITEFKTINGTKVYISILIDNFSRMVLGRFCSLTKQAINSKKCLEFLKQYELPENVELIVDGGSENVNKLVRKYLCSNFPNIQILVAQRDIPYSNSMVEAINKHLKYNYLFKAPIYNFDQCVQFVDFACDHYNKKPKAVINGRSPEEIFMRKQVSVTEVQWKKHSENAKRKRISYNKRFSCCQATHWDTFH